MSRTVQLVCAGSGLAFMVVYGLFFFPVAGYIPPQPPSWTLQGIHRFYLDNSIHIRIGQLGAMMAAFLAFPYWVVISGHLARIERARGATYPVLAVLQMVCAMVTVLDFILCNMLWLIATFRADSDPQVVRAFHDAGWLLFVVVFPGYVIQLSCMGIAALMDLEERPVFPRWAGYLCFWSALSGFGGGLAVFFKTGPFAWNGLIAFYIPVGMFALWLFVMVWLMFRYALRQPASTGTERPVETALVSG